MRETRPLKWACRDRSITIGERPLLMGILNVTPDSFADGGRFLDRDAATARAVQMAEEGADIIDVGGESTRPGAAPLSVDEELARVLPVIEAVTGRTDALVSIDTMKAPVARAALDAGAAIVNDVSACTGDPDMAGVAAEFNAGVVLMHMRGTPRTMQDDPHYQDVVAEVAGYLGGRVEAVRSQGVAEENIAVDPGIGFGKTVAHNLALLAHLGALSNTGRPVVVGLSRKSFLGKLSGREVGDRLPGSLSALVYCILNGAHVMRVHDVRESRDAARVALALAAAR